eukprot:scaffold716_cov139-Skeletonema_menzelii.AAC.7
MTDLQGIDHSVYSEIDPSLTGSPFFYRPKLRAGRSCCRNEIINYGTVLYCKREEMHPPGKEGICTHRTIVAELGSKVEELDAKLAAIEQEVDDEVEHRSSKRRRI